jgi:hypothetical protein
VSFPFAAYRQRQHSQLQRIPPLATTPRNRRADWPHIASSAEADVCFRWGGIAVEADEGFGF